VWSLAPRSTPNLGDEGLHFVWPYTLDCLAWVALPGAYAPVSIGLRITGTHIALHHAKATVLEEIIYRPYIIMIYRYVNYISLFMVYLTILSAV
jgi:hypothetical protein